jgi:dihydrofolate reductase
MRSRETREKKLVDLLVRHYEALDSYSRSAPTDQLQWTRGLQVPRPTEISSDRLQTRKEMRSGKMAEIVVSENVSLDGVVEDPAGDEGFSRGGWVGRIAAREDVAKLALDDALGAEAFLLGRRSYEWFAARWPSRTGALADRLNSLPKYVVSSTLKHPTWNNSTVLAGDPVDEVSGLKQRVNGEIVVAASFRLLHTLLEHDLIDEMRLKVFPVVLGNGKRLFGETTEKKPMRLVESRMLSDGIAYLTYKVVGQGRVADADVQDASTTR